MGYRRVFIIRKDLHLSSGKLAAMVAHCAEAYWTRMIRRHTVINYFNAYWATLPDGTRQEYRRVDLNNLSKEAYEKSKKYFYADSVDEKNPYGELKLSEPRYRYESKMVIDNDIFEEYINGSFVKTICQARNKNHLLKSKEIAKELGLIEGVDFGEINDCCLTELTPENEDGTTLVGIWFKPLPDEVAHKISKKYHLYMD